MVQNRVIKIMKALPEAIPEICERGLRLPSAEEVTRGRSRGIGLYKADLYVREGMFYSPSGRVLIVRGEYNPLVRPDLNILRKKVLKNHTDFYITAHEFEELERLADRDKIKPMHQKRVIDVDTKEEWHSCSLDSLQEDRYFSFLLGETAERFGRWTMQHDLNFYCSTLSPFDETARSEKPKEMWLKIAPYDDGQTNPPKFNPNDHPDPFGRFLRLRAVKDGARAFVTDDVEMSYWTPLPVIAYRQNTEN